MPLISRGAPGQCPGEAPPRGGPAGLVASASQLAIGNGRPAAGCALMASPGSTSWA
jgi:hypothetical protein